MHWQTVFDPGVPLGEIVLRGTIVYLALFFLLRIVLKRESGAVGVTDLLVVVLIADAAQNAMSASYHSITAGLLLVGTIVFWSYALDWLGFHFPWFERIVHPPPLRLVEHGRLLHRNLRKELVTESELRSKLREQGIDSLEEVESAHMEGDGRISVVTAEPPHRPRPPDEQRAV